MLERHDSNKKPATKSTHALREERILAFWTEKGIFERSLKKESPKGEFVFYEGPPTANGKPGIHHLEARAFKDAIPRYKTMQGFHVRRKGGWDTHGLPVEIQVQKELDLKSKKDIEAYGIKSFNEKCKGSVWTYVHEWEDFTNRMGYWIDLKDPYITYKPGYMEAVWGIIKKVDAEGLLYKDYRVVPWCPRDETVLSSHELALGYENVKDLAVTVKFEIQNSEKTGKTYLLAWTTTPWTLPGNVGLAVNSNIEYIKIKDSFINQSAQRLEEAQNPVPNKEITEYFILAKDRFDSLKASLNNPKIEETFKGSDLVGLAYEPIYSFLKDNVGGTEKDKLKNAFKIYAGDFVTTVEGTGIVHIAPMYGQDDFELGTKNDLPKHHLVNEDGTFMDETGFLAGRFVRDEAVAVDIIKDLAHRGFLFHKEKHEHSYPYCWRCHSPLIYFARDSWYIEMSKLRHKLEKENESIRWEPDYIKEGRFGEWLREVKDWAISRERYWGTPLPVWICEKCGKRKVVGLVEELKKPSRNTYYVMRHGEADNNVRNILDSEERDKDNPSHLTEKGVDQVEKAAVSLKNKKFDLVFVSPLARTRETAEILKKKLGWNNEMVIIEDRVREMGMGEWNGQDIREFYKKCHLQERFTEGPKGGENYTDIKKRMGDFLYDLEVKYEGKNILIITHETPVFLLVAAAVGMDKRLALSFRGQKDFISNAEVRKVDFSILPHNDEYELDLHKPYIDEVVLECDCGGGMKRVKEVMDVWLDSGVMPFAQDHEIKSEIRNPKSEIRLQEHNGFSFRNLFQKKIGNYPADFISEAIDQTRGWFYTLHAVGILMGKGKAYKNVICLGHILDAEGKKMSKHIGNVISPWDMMDKYGADALRFWMYSVNQPGEPKSFDEKTVDEVNKKVFNPAANVAAFYKLYAYKKIDDSRLLDEESKNILDRWIMARLSQLVKDVTIYMEEYMILDSARTIKDFISDLSQWYLRRSRDRFKEDTDDKDFALTTTKHVLVTLSKVMAPLTPFFAEYLYKETGGPRESVHLENWPTYGHIDVDCVFNMHRVRDIASKGHEARMVAKINLRQPLQRLSVSDPRSLPQEFESILKDEVNVKEVIFSAPIKNAVGLDTTITPELKEEGDLRELLRKIQDLRKENGLKVGDKASLVVPAEFLSLVDKHGGEIKKATNLTNIEAGDALKLT